MEIASSVDHPRPQPLAYDVRATAERHGAAAGELARPLHRRLEAVDEDEARGRVRLVLDAMGEHDQGTAEGVGPAPAAGRVVHAPPHDADAEPLAGVVVRTDDSRPPRWRSRRRPCCS